MLLAAPVAVHAQQQRATYSFDIPAQDLSSALRAFGQASGQQLAFDEASVRGKRAPALSGAYTADAGAQAPAERRRASAPSRPPAASTPSAPRPCWSPPAPRRRSARHGRRTRSRHARPGRGGDRRRHPRRQGHRQAGRQLRGHHRQRRRHHQGLAQEHRRTADPGARRLGRDLGRRGRGQRLRARLPRHRRRRVPDHPAAGLADLSALDPVVPGEQLDLPGRRDDLANGSPARRSQPDLLERPAGPDDELPAQGGRRGDPRPGQADHLRLRPAPRRRPAERQAGRRPLFHGRRLCDHLAGRARHPVRQRGRPAVHGQHHQADGARQDQPLRPLHRRPRRLVPAVRHQRARRRQGRIHPDRRGQPLPHPADQRRRRRPGTSTWPTAGASRATSSAAGSSTSSATAGRCATASA
jgi:hypothetical protein